MQFPYVSFRASIASDSSVPINVNTEDEHEVKKEKGKAYHAQ